MYENIKQEAALLVLVTVESEKDNWSYQEISSELVNLVHSAGITVKELIHIKCKEVKSALYIGKGKAYELSQIVQQLSVDVVIFNNDLGATQQRNLEEILGIKTIDRTQLILDIFARHAHTQEELR